MQDDSECFDFKLSMPRIGGAKRFCRQLKSGSRSGSAEARAGPFTWLAPSWMDLAKGSETSSVGYMDWKTYPLKTGAEPAAVAAPVEAGHSCQETSVVLDSGEVCSI